MYTHYKMNTLLAFLAVNSVPLVHGAGVPSWRPSFTFQRRSVCFLKFPFEEERAVRSLTTIIQKRLHNEDLKMEIPINFTYMHEIC